MSVPADFLDEIERDLRESCHRVVDEASRLSRLVELHRLAFDASLRRGRAASVVEVFDDTSRSDDERRLVALVRSLRDESA
jgi:hypothetical protein